MTDTVLIAITGFAGVLVGGILASIPQYFQQNNEHKRWLIEKKMELIKEQIAELKAKKGPFLKSMSNLLILGKKFELDTEFITSIPMKVIDTFKKFLPDGKTEISSLTKSKRDEIFIEVATVYEKEIIELEKNLKKLLS